MLYFLICIKQDAEPKKTYPTEKDGMNLHLRVIHEAKQGKFRFI